LGYRLKQLSSHANPGATIPILVIPVVVAVVQIAALTLQVRGFN